jgi:YbbR domain-containing protein
MTKSDYSKFFSFIAFTLAAAVLWFLFRYNNTYVESTTVSVEWINVPVDIELNEKSLEVKVPIKVEASGFRLLWFNYGKANTVIDFEKAVKSSKGELLFYPEKSRDAISEAVGEDIKVLDIDKKPISLGFDKFASKKVLLNKEFKINFTGNFQQIGDSGFDVKEVTITGNDDMVERLDVLNVTIDNIEVEDSLVVQKIDLKRLYPDLRIEPQNVTYTIHAAQMTEGSIRLPIILLNKPEGAKVKLIPESVMVVFSSRLRDYNSIDASDFKVTIDMKELNSNDATAVPIVTYESAYVNEARVQPQSVQILVIQ